VARAEKEGVKKATEPYPVRYSADLSAHVVKGAEMKKKLLILTIALAALLVLAFGGTALAGSPVTVPLYAGQHYLVGNVVVSDAGGYLTVQYNVTEPGWTLGETHVYVGLTAPKKSAPGQFPYKAGEPVAVTAGKTYFIAAHAEVYKLCGYDCPSLSELCAALPMSGQAEVYAYPGSSTYLDLSITGTGKLDGVFPAWCIDKGHDILHDPVAAGPWYDVKFYCGYGPVPDELTAGGYPDARIDFPQNMDLVNYLINNHGSASAAEVQHVIWYLLNGYPESKPLLSPAEQMILAYVEANGEGYTPDFAAGDLYTVIVVPYDAAGLMAQVLLIELPVECTPVYKDETAWALASKVNGMWFGTWKTGWGEFFTYIP